MKKPLVCKLLPLLLSTLVVVGCDSLRPYDLEGELSFAISENVAGYTVVSGERYGFAADVADTLARSLGCKLRVLPHISADSIFKGMKQRSIDIAVIPRSERVLLHDFPSECFYTTDYALMLPAWSSPSQIDEEFWRGKRVLSDKMFHSTATFSSLKGAGAVCDTTRLDGVAMAKRVMAGRADALICEHSEAELVRFLYRSLCKVAKMEECEYILVFADRHIKEAFVEWFDTFSTSKEYATLIELYFHERPITERFEKLRYRHTRVVEGISVWDEQLRYISAQVGVDWRLMSAMAYHESRFRNDQVSHKGAVGLMQVTPIVAEDLGLDEGYDLADPATNIWLAARLIRRSSRALGFGDFPTTDDRIAIVVASYNCGITRTLEAQRLVVAAGGMGDSWEDIAEMMTNMSRPEWIATSDYKMRRFGDAPVTIGYTNAVMELYNTYRGAIN